MALALIALGMVLLGAVPVWGVPLGAAILGWCAYAPRPMGEVVVVALALGCAAPLSVALAGAILDRVCRVGALPTAGGFASFKLVGLVLVGVVALQSEGVIDLVATVRVLAARGGAIDLLGIAVRVGGAVCLCGGLLAVIGLGAIVLIELPLRWCLSPYRVSPLDISLGAVRPLIIVGVAAAVFHLGAALVAHEVAPHVLGGGL